MRRLASIALIIIAIATGAAGCAPKRLALPTGPGAPAPDFLQTIEPALVRCRQVRTLQAELSLSGQVGRQRLRGRVLSGFAPDAFRLEALAPFGAPVFIVVADAAKGTLLLSRDRRVLQNALPADILEALIGVPLGPADLMAVLSGCVKASAEPAGGRAYGPDWLAVDLVPDGILYFQRQSSVWRLVAGQYAGLEIEYPGFAGERPSQIQIRSAPQGARADVSVSVGVSQLEINGELLRERLVEIAIPPGTSPIDLEELRRLGPTAEAADR